MLQATCIVTLVIHMLYNYGATALQSFYGVRTDENPKSSCHRITNIESTGKCLGTCGTIIDRIVMISHDESTNTCMCCNNLTGTDIIGSIWKTFSPGK